MTLSRRDFMAAAGAGAVGALVGTGWAATTAVDPVTSIDNPLKSYPNRDWEQVYHDIYEYDAVDWTVCHPNCTQSCALNFYMKNGVPIRAEQIYHEEEGSPGPGSPGGYEEADVSRHWNPRGCMKGLTVHRRTYEPSRIKYPMVRKGWDPDDPSPEGRGEDPETIDSPDLAPSGGGPEQPVDGPGPPPGTEGTTWEAHRSARPDQPGPDSGTHGRSDGQRRGGSDRR